MPPASKNIRKMKILILNGPNLNLLGVREPAVYGSSTFADYYDKLVAMYLDVELSYYQSNVEGELINKIHEVGFSYDGIVLNAGAYTHTSIAILDAAKAVNIPMVEVHISKVEDREEFRQVSYIRAACFETITGMGIQGYRRAIIDLADKLDL